jgi:hypothetical protein
MNRSKLGVLVGSVLASVGVVGLVVHADSFVDNAVIGNPLARISLSPLGVRDLGGAVVQSWHGSDGMNWWPAIAAASNGGELGIAYSLIDVGAESLSGQLRAAGATERVPLVYALKAYMYLMVTPWWMLAGAACVGGWVRSHSRGF